MAKYFLEKHLKGGYVCYLTAHYTFTCFEAQALKVNSPKEIIEYLKYTQGLIKLGEKGIDHVCIRNENGVLDFSEQREIRILRKKLNINISFWREKNKMN
jgi:pyruvate/oxaloacetate carboxyltransferase